MSTRLYPLYKAGNPQLRVFLPNFWMKLIPPVHQQPPNVVQFSCSMEMTRHDIKNYLEKIYKVPVVNVRTRIELGKFVKDPIKQYIKKEDDLKLAYVVLPKDVVFQFPDIFGEKEEEKKKEKREDEKALDMSSDNFKKYLDKNKNRVGLPSWYSI
uniref:Large ribosomal subunit protein uL23m n=1 Tax=Culicoides sonorensis TaxID=179676 RepID=A0A336MED3_CULSO